MAGKSVKCNRMLPDGKSALWFSTALIEWYGINKRSLPWRDVSEPYLIWLSEVILQQTRVEQGMAYYRKMAERYPSVYDLAAAEEEDVLKMWQGLGYYSRARNMHATARHIAENLNGEFPRNYKELLKLKGVGVQTAAAIASFAFDLPHPVIDGNVIRVLSRYFGIERDASHAGGRMYFSDLAHSIMAKKQSA
ncbi:MAG: A/G-specific adenine glycosylase, partial [Flavobacteriales bacterium]